MGYTLAVDKREDRGVWEGWGCSLAWWAHAVGGKRRQDLYADLFFTDRTVRFLDQRLPGLHLNIIRYNIGGGGRRDAVGDAVEQVPDILHWHRDIDGYWIDGADANPRSRSWDWTRDAAQRAVLRAALARGVDRVEFFSNAPMWWMMTTRSSAGGALLPERRRDFARYLAAVVQHAQNDWGVRVDYVAPFNEPSAGWWNFPKNQEGCNVGRAEQAEILRFLRAELDRRGLQKIAITASDENTMPAARETLEYLKQRGVADFIAKVNVHGYAGLRPWRDNSARRALRESAGSRRLWMSEFGNGDGSGRTLARSITEDLSFLRPTAWLHWQPLEPSSAWGLVNGRFADRPEDPDTGAPTRVYTSYYVMAQFTRFLRPGHRLLGSSDPNSIVAHDAKNRRLVIITFNRESAQPIDYDLSGLRSVGASAGVTTTSTDGSQLFETSRIALAGKRLTLPARARSIYSLVINDVAL